MKKYLTAFCAAAALLLAGAVSLYERYTAGMSAVNPLTGDIPWVVIGIVGGLAVVGIIVLTVMGKKGKK